MQNVALTFFDAWRATGLAEIKYFADDFVFEGPAGPVGVGDWLAQSGDAPPASLVLRGAIAADDSACVVFEARDEITALLFRISWFFEVGGGKIRRLIEARQRIYSDELICEYCGERGWHSECEAAKAVAVTEASKQAEAAQLQRLAVHGRYGAVGEASEAALTQAAEVLQESLGRPHVFDRGRAIEGERWWYIPARQIGLLGFIVEKKTCAVYSLGSGLVGLNPHDRGLASHWIGIEAYLAGKVNPDRA